MGNGMKNEEVMWNDNDLMRFSSGRTGFFSVKHVSAIVPRQ